MFHFVLNIKPHLGIWECNEMSPTHKLSCGGCNRVVGTVVNRSRNALGEPAGFRLHLTATLQNFGPTMARNPSILFYFIHIMQLSGAQSQNLGPSVARNPSFYLFRFTVGLHLLACGNSFPWPGIEPWVMAVKACNPKHWDTRELLILKVPQFLNTGN